MPTGVNNNLIPTTELTEKERTEMARKAGKRSVEVRAAKKEKKDLLKLILEIKPTDAKDKKIFEKYNIPPEFMTNELLAEIALVERAKKGDIQAIRYLDERKGVNPQLELKRQELELKQKAIEPPSAEPIEIILRRE